MERFGRDFEINYSKSKEIIDVNIGKNFRTCRENWINCKKLIRWLYEWIENWFNLFNLQ